MSLERFLEKSAGRGEARDSGQFTLSLESALRKLSEFTFHHPFDWLLAYIQGANAARASGIQIRVARSAITVKLESLRSEFLDDLLEMLEGSRKLSTAGEAFRRAIISLLNLDNFQFTQGTLALEWCDGKLETKTVFGKSNDLILTVCLADGSGIFKAGVAADLSLHMVQRARYSRVPIIIDGLEITGRRAWDSVDHTARLVVFATGYVPNKYAKFRFEYIDDDVLMGSRPLTEFGPQWSKEHLTFSCHLKQDRVGEFEVVPAKSCYRVVKHGVVIKEWESDPHSIVMKALFHRDNAKTDLSGIALVGDDTALRESFSKIVQRGWTYTRGQYLRGYNVPNLDQFMDAPALSFEHDLKRTARRFGLASVVSAALVPLAIKFPPLILVPGITFTVIPNLVFHGAESLNELLESTKDVPL